MLALVTRKASGENVLTFSSQDIQKVRDWLRAFGLDIRPKRGWCNEDDTRTGAIHYDHGTWRATIWMR